MDDGVTLNNWNLLNLCIPNTQAVWIASTLISLAFRHPHWKPS